MDGTMVLKVFSPVDGALVLEREAVSLDRARQALERAQVAGQRWSTWPLEDRQELLLKAVEIFVAQKDTIARELTVMMGRPLRFSPGEIKGFQDRAQTMIALAPEALACLEVGEGRYVERLPVGVVLVVAAWNYPYLIAVNSVIPALAAGNAVLLKHSTQTMACAERLQNALLEAGLPEGVFQALHLTHEGTEALAAEVDLTMFTGSVSGGRAVHRAVGGTFRPVGLELGGKDPAYVREDALLEFTATSLAEGAFFNSGQSCCGIERIYVHRSRFHEFIDELGEAAHVWKLGNPLEPDTFLGPMVSERAADAVRDQVAQAKDMGAHALLNSGPGDGAYLPAEILIDVHHGMAVMTEETFGPVVGVMPVDSDEEALLLMNDSPFGLTASIWTQDLHRASALGRKLVTGTVFANRCDYLDPALAWTGFKDSGRGCTLSRWGYESLTRPKSFNLRAVPF